MDTAWCLYGTDGVAVCNDSDNIMLTITLSVISQIQFTYVNTVKYLIIIATTYA